MRTSQLNVGTSTDVSLKITESDLSQLTASIRAPSGNEEPCLLKRLPNRHIGEHSDSWGGAGVGEALGMFCLMSPLHRDLLYPQGGGRTCGERTQEWQARHQQPL